jgi:hypothetical protein
LFHKHGFYNEDFSIVADLLFHLGLVVFGNITPQWVDIVFANYETGGVSARLDARKKTELRKAVSLLFPERVTRDFYETAPLAFFFGEDAGVHFFPGAWDGRRLLPYATLFNPHYNMRSRTLGRLHVFITVVSLKALTKLERLFFMLFRKRRNDA